MKGSSCPKKLRYEGYLELIYKYLLDDIYTELTRMKILYGDITCVYEKAHIMVV